MSIPFTKALKEFFEAQQYYDVTFNVKGEDIHAHKLILSIRTPVFKTMITNPISYVDGKILISDPNVTPADFKQLLTFIYSDGCEINRENLEALLHLGNMYDVPLLLEKCAEFVETNLNASNLLEYAEIGLIYDGQCSLLEKCFKQIPKCFFNEAEQNSSSQLKFSLLKASPALILKIAQDCMRVDGFTEDKLFEAVFDWAKNECTKNPERNSLKSVLKEILPFIKFENLKPITLATTVADNKLLKEKELLDSILKSTKNESKKTNEPNNPRKRRHLVPDAPRGHVIPEILREQNRRYREHLQEQRQRLEQEHVQMQEQLRQQMDAILALRNRN